MFDPQHGLGYPGFKREPEPTVNGDIYPRARILIVDDDQRSAELVGQYLSQHNFRISYEFDSARAVARIVHEQPDLVLLDLLMPGLDGLSICRQVRAEFSNPIVILTGLQEEVDVVTGLEMGADAYLTKPVTPRVLLAHIRAQLRNLNDQLKIGLNELQINSEGILIDLKKRAVYKSGIEIELTNAEYDLLAYLAHQRGTVVPRNEIYKKLRKLEYNGIDRGIDLRISRLRKKLDDDPKCPRLIKTVRGVGYLFAG